MRNATHSQHEAYMSFFCQVAICLITARARHNIWANQSNQTSIWKTAHIFEDKKLENDTECALPWSLEPVWGGNALCPQTECKPKIKWRIACFSFPMLLLDISLHNFESIEIIRGIYRATHVMRCGTRASSELLPKQQGLMGALAVGLAVPKLPWCYDWQLLVYLCCPSMHLPTKRSIGKTSQAHQVSHSPPTWE